VRAVRLDTHRVRIGTADGILLNLSSSGALVRMPRLVPIAADATLSLYADNTWLDVPCRVVRCTETEVQMTGAVWQRKEFETAVTFYDATALADILDIAGQADRLR
jgi:PilZ domain